MIRIHAALRFWSMAEATAACEESDTPRFQKRGRLFWLATVFCRPGVFSGRSGKRGQETGKQGQGTIPDFGCTSSLGPELGKGLRNLNGLLHGH